MVDIKTVSLTTIPNKRYFKIGEASQLCLVKPHVLRCWEQTFAQFQPAIRTGNRRYYKRQDVQMAREIRRLLYDEGFTIAAAKQQLIKFKQQIKQDKPLYEVKVLLQATIAELDEISNQLKQLGL